MDLGDSPIETRLFDAIVSLTECSGMRLHLNRAGKRFPMLAHRGRVETDPIEILLSLFEAQPHQIWHVEAQKSYLGYFIDFAFTHSERPLFLAVECDGHEFHDRTKQQASHDRKRDRTLLRAGVSTIRFTGSDIVRDARRCAEEIIAQLFLLWSRQ